MKIRHDINGKILAVGDELPDSTSCQGELPADFFNTFGLGKYKAQAGEDGIVSIVEDTTFVMPEKAEYTVIEIQAMTKEQLLELRDKLQVIIGSK